MGFGGKSRAEHVRSDHIVAVASALPSCPQTQLADMLRAIELLVVMTHTNAAIDHLARQVRALASAKLADLDAREVLFCGASLATVLGLCHKSTPLCRDALATRLGASAPAAGRELAVDWAELRVALLYMAKCPDRSAAHTAMLGGYYGGPGSLAGATTAGMGACSERGPVGELAVYRAVADEARLGACEPSAGGTLLAATLGPVDNWSDARGDTPLATALAALTECRPLVCQLAVHRISLIRDEYDRHHRAVEAVTVPINCYEVREEVRLRLGRA